MLPNRDKLPCRSSKGESGVIVLSAGDYSAQLWGRSEAGKGVGEGVADAVLRVLG